MLVRGINNLSDARYCAGMGADGLIFTLDPSLPGAVTPELIRELAGWVSGVELIGEFTPATPYPAINELVQTCGLSRVLLLYDEPYAVEFFKPALLAVPVIVEVSPEIIFDAYERDAMTSGLASHFPAGFGLAIEADSFLPNQGSYQEAARPTSRPSLWLSGQLTPNTALQSIGLGLAGLILPGGDEIKPGLRDFTELEAIFEALEAD